MSRAGGSGVQFKILDLAVPVFYVTCYFERG